MSEQPVEDDAPDYMARLDVADHRVLNKWTRTRDIIPAGNCRVLDLYEYLFHEVPAGALVSIDTDKGCITLTWKDGGKE